jgi:hypothetical protein
MASERSCSMPRLHLFNWTAFAFWALLALIVGSGDALISRLFHGTPYSVHSALKKTLEMCVVGVIWVFFMRDVMRRAERDSQKSVKTKPDKGGDLAEL